MVVKDPRLKMHVTVPLVILSRTEDFVIIGQLTLREVMGIDVIRQLNVLVQHELLPTIKEKMSYL